MSADHAYALRTYAIVAVALTAACAQLRADEHPDESIEDTARIVVDTALSEGWTGAQIEADPVGAVRLVRELWAALPSGGAR